ncbi:hypothetical protein [Bradyrhizobium diazoefficiens]|uniref:hypothetical protein n=2 Tax=Bradyrhizobium TaxID=374 RepID=UPI000765FA73|nr:hypothetical protein [Bradyrhizobium diazoefficiens]MBR0868353.1 hypothetical protein [Bradyrhizobium diazoefficiens]MBR0892877.1 hypothetical protein [Bradyrhizobium diazoefficiens]MBR0924561.1 hypothetical protein [Bradyrhizobium diazoefficiens]
MYHPLDRPISPQKQRIIERANKLRGMLVGSYSQVEYLLGNLWVSMEQVDPYFTKRNEFPYRLPSRVKAIRQLLDVPHGPLFQFRAKAVELLDEMDAYERHRRMMAHGYMEVEHSASGHLVRVRFYEPTKDDAANEVHTEMSLNKMEADAKKAADFAGRWMRLQFDIHAQFGWVAPATTLRSHKSQGIVVQSRRRPS